MVLRKLLFYLSNNEHLVQRLSETYPVRRAAQLFVLMLHRGKYMLEDSKLRERAMNPEEFKAFIKKAAQNIRDEMQQAAQSRLKRK